MKALRYNEGKPQLSRMRRAFPWAIEVIARIKELGAIKYEEDNWRLGGKPDAEYLDSCDRHIAKFLAGEHYDPDSGCHHLGHAIWNICALMQLNYTMPVIDAERFADRCTYWRLYKEAKSRLGREPIPGVDFDDGEGHSDLDDDLDEYTKSAKAAHEALYGIDTRTTPANLPPDPLKFEIPETVVADMNCYVEEV
jgi:hypothetical protein